MREFEGLGAITARITGQAQPARPRTPVRRHSYAAGREGVFWRPMKRADAWQIVEAAERYDEQTRKAGQRNGALGHVALAVLKYLVRRMDNRTGQLDPAIDTIAAKVRRSRSAVIEALKALRQHGFLDWLRRYVPTENEGRGPQVRQTSNAYRLFLPAAARRLLGRLATPAPAPDDFTHGQESRAAEIEAMRAGLPLKERLLFCVTDGPLEAALGRLIDAQERRKQRESGERPESITGLNFNTESA